jgi:hypothetical protein
LKIKCSFETCFAFREFELADRSDSG